MIAIAINNAGIVGISGSLDFVTVTDLNLQAKAFIKQNSDLIFDLSKVDFSDNSGVALLVSLTRFAKNHGRKISFINVPKQLSDLINAGGLREILPLTQIK